MPKNKRFKRENFPKRKPKQRRTFSWGVVCLYPDKNPKFSVVVSKKVFKKAVDRNRAKRRVYGLLENSLHTKKPSYSAVFYLKKPSLTIQGGVLSKDIEETL